LPNKDKINLSINLLAETTFLATSLLYYYRIYKRCEAFKTPIIPTEKSFPMATSNRVLAYDCTASTSDSVILILKTVAFALKISIKFSIQQYINYCDKPNIEMKYQAIGQLANKNKQVKHTYLTKYPRQIYQILLLINAPIFLILTFSSWLPTYNKFNSSNTGCPNFYKTCWNSLSPNSTLNADCNTDMYKWQKFSWAEQFLFMVISAFCVYQLLKIIHDSSLLCCENKIKALYSKTRPTYSKIESSLALPGTVLLFSESIAVAHLLIVSSHKFPGGIGELIKHYVTTAFQKLNHLGYIDNVFTNWVINMTKLDQKIFYGLLAAQLFSLPFSIAMYFLTKSRMNDDEIHKLTRAVGNYLRQIIGNLAIAAPIITFIIFFIGVGATNSKDTCFLDNFFHSLFNIFNEKSQIILSGDKHACNLYSVSAYQGSAILQTAYFVETFLAFPTAFYSIITTLDICINKKNSTQYSQLRRFSFVPSKETKKNTVNDNHSETDEPDATGETNNYVLLNTEAAVNEPHTSDLLSHNK
jgi:hypothetical protein